MANKTAPDGQIYVCTACGKRSKDQYGEKMIDRGWDCSCMLNCVLCYEDKGPDGLYIPVDPIERSPQRWIVTQGDKTMEVFAKSADEAISIVKGAKNFDLSDEREISVALENI